MNPSLYIKMFRAAKHSKAAVSCIYKTFVSKPEHSSETNGRYADEDPNDGFERTWSTQKQLYPDHIPTTDFQKVLLTVGSAFMALADPFRDDMVAVLGETTAGPVVNTLLARMQSSPEGREILRDRPRINSTTVPIDKLKELPESAFGNVYAKFMEKNGITSDSRQPVHFVDDADYAYVVQRYRETHDMVHALLDMPTNMLGEVTVKWVEALQTRLPMCIGAALFGPLRLKPKQRVKYQTTYLPWAIRCGHEAEFLLNIYFEKRLEQPVEELRRELSIPPLPT